MTTIVGWACTVWVGVGIFIVIAHSIRQGLRDERVTAEDVWGLFGGWPFLVLIGVSAVLFVLLPRRIGSLARSGIRRLRTKP